MAFPRKPYNYIPAEITSNPDIMGGEPCVAGTRVPAAMIIAELQGGMRDVDVFDGYPSLPFDGIDAVRAWARAHDISVKPAGD